MSQNRGGHRWTITLILTSVLGLLVFLQSDGSTDRVGALQDVVIKSKPKQGAMNERISQEDESEDYPANDGLSVIEETPLDQASSADHEVSKATDKAGAQQLAEKDKRMNDCPTMCLAQVKQHKKRWRGELLNSKDLGRLVEEAREKMIARLKVDYGEENYSKIFEVNGQSRGWTAFLYASPKDGVSIERFKRKLKLKILTVQKAILKELEVFGDCDCKTGAKESSVRYLAAGDKTAGSGLSTLPDHYARMVWATGGHSAAASHGNLWNQSYTAFMEQAVTEVFGSIGVDFEGRNYAMGGTDAAPEIALCSEAVFGADADVISWDFAMTDGRYWDRKGMYANRVGLNSNRPAIVDMHIDKFLERRTEELRRVEERGLTALYLDPSVYSAMKDGIPDTFGLTAEQINSMPHMVRHFKCQDAIEKGDPTCSANKFDNHEICPDRKGMSQWHPGWKVAALEGNMLAVFLCDMLRDAIAELGANSNPSELLTQLRNEEDADYKKFFQSSVPDVEEMFLKTIGEELLNEANMTVFYRSPSICHTARLPAESRYLGILTESKQTGITNYYKGITMKEASKMESDETADTPMPLVYNEEEREDCEAELTRDYKDYFFTSSKQGWTTLTFPNEAEKRAYGRESEKLHGILVLCLAKCDWGRCPEGDMQRLSIMNGQVNLEVNGQSITDVTDFSGCFVLRGEKGHYWQPNDAGQYVVRARVLGDGSHFSYLRISSVIVL